ncbi:MAG TPA: glycosyltransferase family 4 protein [Bacteroidales bacterium]|nr:glycosyltransferase family 4 protein [Bacteroidales bacterium]
MAFIKYGSFSHINESVLNELKKNFPDIIFDEFDLIPAKYSMDTVWSVFHALTDHGKGILFGPKKLLATFNRTAYFFKKRRDIALKALGKEEYLFTFQTQALFDASIPGIPHFLYTDHTHLENLRYPGYDKRLLVENWINLEKQAYRNASLVFTMSSNISRSLVQDYGCDPSKVVCVYGGSNVSISDRHFDEERYSRKNILFVGVDWERKGGPVLVEAFRQVLKVHPDATLSIVGCKPELNVPNCRVMGKLDLDEVKLYLGKASVFCLPSRLEPFGIAFLEAMALKLPVVATTIGSIPDFIHEGRNGYLVEPDNPAELANALINLLGSEDKCRSFGEYGYSLVHERYTWTKTGRGISENIKSVLNNRDVKARQAEKVEF